MFEICQVEATFCRDGLPRPTKLVWQGKQYAVIDYGRHWQTDDGWHILIHVANSQGFELLYSGSLWYGRIMRHPTQDQKFFV